MKDVPSKIRKDKLWQEVYELTKFIYSKIDDIAAEFPDEKFATAYKLRQAANDSLFYVSQATGCALVDASVHDWNMARKNLFSLQSMYTFGAKEGFTELEPKIIVQIDNLLEEVDKRIADSKKAIKKRDKDELEPWLEKYKIWQKMQD